MLSMAPTPGPASAAPTPWGCAKDTFVVRRGATLTLVDVATGAITNGPNLSVPPPNDTNAIARHPLTGVVYAVDVTGPGPNSTIARVINPDGTVENVSATVPMTGLSASDYAGGTFTDDGHWIVANGAGQITVVDLTTPSSPTYGTTVANASFGLPWLSGDMAYRASDNRIYFIAWSTALAPIPRVGWISMASVMAGGPVTATFGPNITLPSGVFGVAGSSLGFDGSGDLWFHGAAVPGGNIIWSFDGNDLTAAGPIAPTVVPGLVQTGSGSDGFMCTASADLALTKTDGNTSVDEGDSITYTLEVTNTGPGTADGAIVVDPVVANFSATSLTCTASGGAACPTPADLSVALLQGAGLVIPSLPVGGLVSFAVTGTAGAATTIANVATVTPPPGVSDLVLANNQATDNNSVAATTTTTTTTTVLPVVVATTTTPTSTPASSTTTAPPTTTGPTTTTRVSAAGTNDGRGRGAPLAFTGSGSSPIVAASFVALLAGALALVARRRIKHPEGDAE